MSSRRQGHRAPPAPHQMLAVATKQPILRISTEMELSGLHQTVKLEKVVFRKSLQSNCTLRAQFPWGQLAVLPGRVQRDMMWTLSCQGQVICLITKCPQDLPFHPGEKAREAQVLTNRLHKGETAGVTRLLCLLDRAGTAYTSTQRHTGKIC